MFQPQRSIRRLTAPLLLSLWAAGAVTTALAAPPVSLDIPAGRLGDVLARFAAQTHQQFLYSAATVAGRTAPAIKGRFPPDQALLRLLSGSGIVVERTGPATVILKRPDAAGSDAPLARTSTSSLATSALEHAEAQGEPVQSPSTPTRPEDGIAAVQEVVVTGTHIRGVKVTASPLVTLSRDDLARAGDATIADALDRLPQNFAGTSTPSTALTGADRTGSNGAIAQGVNLRGLGANATLVLLDGRRLPGTGAMGNFADVSAIPTAVVDHVEVLLDGASAIYGSDAVAGVVNIITRRDFNGAESLVRYGEDAGGHGPSLQVSQTLGTTWDGGHAVFAYEFQHDGDLPASAHPYTANSDLRALGGLNFDTIESSPGNILTFNAAKGAYVPLYAIPPGSGVGLTPASFTAGTSNLNNTRAGTDVLPTQDKNSVYLEAAQKLDPKTEVNLEARYNLRVFQSAFTAGQTIFNVTNANPYFVSPNGATSELIGYSGIGALGPYRTTGRSKSFDLSLGLDREFLETWKLHTYVAFTGEQDRRYVANEFNSAHLSEALGATPDNPATAFSTAVDGYFNPYGNGASNSKTVLAFIGDGFSREVDSDQLTTVNIEADGDVIALPGGVVKAAFGAQYRHERGEFFSESITSATPFIVGGVGYVRDLAAAFGELNIPLVGPQNAVPGVRSLTLSVAGRVEHYDDVGTTANPKLGLVWVPVRDVSVHASYGTSFRAPALYELHDSAAVSVVNVPNGAASTLSLIEYGGNTALQPETATSWTAGVDWSPHWLRGLHLGASWFNIDYSGRIGDPGGSSIATVLTDPAYATLVTRVNGANPADLAKVDAVLANASPASAALYPPSAFGAIIDARFLNVSSLLVSGVDLDARYGIDLGADYLGLTGSASYLYNYRQKTTPGALAEQLVSTAGEPVDWRARLTGDWARGPYDAALTVNFVDSYRDPTNQRAIASWTTADLTGSWTSPARTGSLHGVVVSVAVQNLFDQDPPFYNAYYGIGYDPTNASPLGRVVSVQLLKRW